MAKNIKGMLSQCWNRNILGCVAMRKIRVVTVLGGNGTIGKTVSAVFASFGNAKVYMVGRDEGRLNVARREAALSVRAGTVARNLYTRTYDCLEECITESDLVFEAVAEDLDTKKSVLTKASQYLADDAILCSGTSGLSIETMAESLFPNLRNRFMGVHFFNPPYSMPLCEVIPCDCCDTAEVEAFCSYLRDDLRRTTVILKDRPAFLANRIGFQFINSALRLAERFADKGGIIYVDSLFGPFSGRTMPPIATADFVGFDVTAAIVDNVIENTEDWANDSYELPEFCRDLVRRGLLGRKAGRGAYAMERLSNGSIRRVYYDIINERYTDMERIALPFRDSMVQSFRDGDYTAAMRALVCDSSEESRLCLSQLVEYILYGVEMSHEVGRSVHDGDTAMASGFGWCPPLALADALSLVRSFTDIAYETTDMGMSLCKRGDVERILSYMEPSEYDFRPYFRAKV